MARDEGDEVINGTWKVVEKLVEQTSVYLVNIPNRYNLVDWPCVNHEVRRTNQRLKKLSEKYSNVSWVEASEAERHMHTRQGLQFNIRWTAWLSEMIAKAVKTLFSMQ